MDRLMLRVLAWHSASGDKHFKLLNSPPLVDALTPGRARRLAEALRDITAEVEHRLDRTSAVTFEHPLYW